MFGLVLGSGLRGCGQPGLPWVLPRIKLTHEAGSNWKSCTLRCDRCGRFRLRAPGGSAFSARRDTELCSQQAQKIYPRHQYSENEVAVETYVIWRKGGGFFSIIASILGRLHLAQQLGATPFVDLETHPTVYQELEPVNGTRNVWEYYFQPVSNVSKETALEHNTHQPGGEYPRGIPYSMLRRPLFLDMWQQYVKFNDITNNNLESMGSAASVGSNTLGIHFRGQEMRTEAGHPLPPTMRQMLAAAKNTLEHQNFDRIFLATEAKQYVSAFRRAFGSRLEVSPTFRLRNRNSYTVRKPPRKFHKYNLGLEALNEAVTLSKCGGFIGCDSNLSDAAAMLGGGLHEFSAVISNGPNYRISLARHLNWRMRAMTPARLGGFAHWQERLVVRHPEAVPVQDA